jgi:hypothetical protein
MSKIDVCIASLYRNGHVVKTIESVIGAPEINRIYLICNAYTDTQYEAVRSALDKYHNISILRRNNKKGCSEKFLPFTASTAEYLSNLDDDLVYPQGFYGHMLKKADELNAIVSIHGRINKPGKVKSYYRDLLVAYRSMRAVEKDMPVEVIATCGTVFKKSLMPGIEQLYGMVQHKNMSDIYFSKLAKDNNVKMYVVAHDKDWIRHKEKEEGDRYIFSEYADNCAPQTEYFNKHFR